MTALIILSTLYVLGTAIVIAVLEHPTTGGSWVVPLIETLPELLDIDE